MVSRARWVLVMMLAAWAPASAVSTAARAAEKEQGKKEFERALRYSKAGEWEAALPWFKKAYQLSGRRPSAILALAQCERELRQLDAALEHFREYLATRPRPKDARSVEETIAVLEELQKEQVQARREQEAKEAKQREDAQASGARAAAPQRAPEPAPAELRPPPPKPVAAVVAPTPAPAKDEGGLLSSPVFWIVAGAVVVAGGVGVGVVLASGEASSYGGSTGVVLGP